MIVTGKVWGTTRPLLQTPFIEAHWIEVEPFSKCSLHQHVHKFNAFILLSGSLFVHVEQTAYPLVDITELSMPGEVTIVAPGLYHQFETKHHPATVIELYSLLPLSEDIVRKTVGEHAAK